MFQKVLNTFLSIVIFLVANSASGENSIIFHHHDHLSGTSVSTDRDGNVVEVVDYYPFGDVRIDEKATGYKNNYKFTGKELDLRTNLYYYGARYYDPVTGRFISPDPWEGDLANPQTLNKYSYVTNNPLKYVDPTGERVSEYQVYAPPEGGSYALGDKMGAYRGIEITSAAGQTGYGTHQYQCTTLAKDYALSQHGVDLRYTGNGVDYGSQSRVSTSFETNNPNDPGQYIVYENGSTIMPQEDDIISWSGGEWGHVGFIAEVSFDESTGTGFVYTVEQNMEPDQGLFRQSFTRTYNDEGQAVYTIEGRGNLDVQGWTRYENQSRIREDTSLAPNYTDAMYRLTTPDDD